MPGNNIRESYIEQKLVAEVKKRGGMCIKLVPMFFSGLPDRLILMPHKQICFVETKAPNKKARPLQSAVHRMIIKLGFDVFIVDSSEDIKAVINSFKFPPD